MAGARNTELLGSEDGFTLIELMVAMTVLLIALMGFMAAEQVSIKLDVDTENQQAALDAAAAQLEETRSVRPAGLERYYLRR